MGCRRSITQTGFAFSVNFFPLFLIFLPLFGFFFVCFVFVFFFCCFAFFLVFFLVNVCKKTLVNDKSSTHMFVKGWTLKRSIVLCVC